MILKPQLVVASGIAGTGKSSTLAELARIAPNLFVLEKDSVNQGAMHVKVGAVKGLPDFQAYVSDDAVFPDNAREVDTIYGPMISVDPKNGFYGRHGRDQAYLVMERLAKFNLDLGKVPVIDCFVIRQIRDGTMAAFLEQQLFGEHPRKAIHFACDPDDCYQRLCARAERDSAARARDGGNIKSRDYFVNTFVRDIQPMVPGELQSIPHLLVNTSGKTSRAAAEECLSYLLD